MDRRHNFCWPAGRVLIITALVIEVLVYRANDLAQIPEQRITKESQMKTLKNF